MEDDFKTFKFFTALAKKLLFVVYIDKNILILITKIYIMMGTVFLFFLMSILISGVHRRT